MDGLDVSVKLGGHKDKEVRECQDGVRFKF